MLDVVTGGGTGVVDVVDVVEVVEVVEVVDIVASGSSSRRTQRRVHGHGMPGGFGLAHHRRVVSIGGQRPVPGGVVKRQMRGWFPRGVFAHGVLAVPPRRHVYRGARVTSVTCAARVTRVTRVTRAATDGVQHSDGVLQRGTQLQHQLPTRRCEHGPGLFGRACNLGNALSVRGTAVQRQCHVQSKATALVGRGTKLKQ